VQELHAAAVSARAVELMELARDHCCGAASWRAAFECGETVFRGNRIEGTFERASLVIGRLETVARTVVEKARNVYRTVEKLAQLKAGRVRTVVDGSHVVRARKTTVHADEDVRIQANKIHLG
jgi:hypothetical protein